MAQEALLSPFWQFCGSQLKTFTLPFLTAWEPCTRVSQWWLPSTPAFHASHFLTAMTNSREKQLQKGMVCIVHLGDGHVSPLVTLYQQSAGRETWMLVLSFFYPFFPFYSGKYPNTWDVAAHGRVSPRFSFSGNTQTFFGDSKPSWQWLYSLQLKWSP